jgi:uncharacterized protein YecA (UPF0149 family)
MQENPNIVKVINILPDELQEERPGTTKQPEPKISETKASVQALNKIHKITAARNDLCPCGSGKKFKKCHFLINK